MRHGGRVEYAQARKMRERNTPLYRLAHWPIWIWVFFLAPGPLTFSLFAHGFGWRNMTWLLLVLVGTGIAGLRGQLPGVEPRPYILRFDENKPNPLYRRVCYTFAWNAVLSFSILNMAGLLIAAVTGTWYMAQVYRYAYLPVCGTILLLGAACGALDPRRRHGTAIFLRLGLGGHRVTGASPGSLEDLPPDAGVESDEAGYLCVYAPADGFCGISRDAPADPPHCAWGLDRRRLKEALRRSNILSNR
jgi:hypothetical protein